MDFTFILEWLAAGIVSAFIVVIVGAAVVGILSAVVGNDSNAVKVAIIILVIFGIILAVWIHGFLDFSESGDSGGDGVHTCLNCGRDEELVPGYGYCDICYEGYVEWREDYWAENHFD